MRPDIYPFLHFQIPTILHKCCIYHFLKTTIFYHGSFSNTTTLNRHSDFIHITVKVISTTALSNAISTKSVMFQMSKTLHSVWTTAAESYDTTSTITALEANPPSCTGILNVSFMNEMSHHCRPSHHQTL
jgi:hypothetical protein